MGFVIDAARAEDAAPCAAILMSWVQENAWMPKLWTLPQTEAFVSGLIERGSVSVLRNEAGQVAGFLDLHEGWINCLYLAPQARGQGQGKALIAHAARLHTSGLHLWCFAENQAAVRFYTDAGFREVARTEGDNDEGLPDIQFYRPGGEER